jgi:small conductance mechanosensitive channel
VEYASVSLSGLKAQLDADPDNADIIAVLIDLNFKRGLVVSSLNRIIYLRERLGENSDQYKAVLVKGSSGISVGLLSFSVVRSVFRDWGLAMAATAKADAPDIIFKLLLFFSIIITFRFLSRMTRNVVKRSCEKSSLDVSNLLKDILISGSGGTVMLLGVFMALSQIGISLGPMLAGLGVAGFVIGFALQDTLGNFAAGAMILIYRPYDVDDFVEVTGASGLVRKMNLVSTTITTFDNQTLVVPNSRIWGDVIKNVTAQKLRRVDLEFGVGYGDDIEHTERVLRDIIDSHDLILSEPATLIKLHTLGESSVNFIVRPWAKTEDYWNVYWDIMREVKMRFDREGISIPFPQRDIHVTAETNPAEVSPS